MFNIHFAVKVSLNLQSLVAASLFV